MRKIFLNIFFLFIANLAFTQDTIRVMAYNILNYTSTDANKTRYKDLKVIVNYFKPDVLIVSELNDASGAQLLLDSALNSGSPGAFSRAIFYNGPDTDNMLYYRNQKIKLKSQAQVSTTLRDISHYRIYHLNGPSDTSWINLFSAHLKAGSFPSDESDRLSEVTSFCNYIGNLNSSDNVIIGGDFNVYSSADLAWQHLTNSGCSMLLQDPINTPGAWNNNSVFNTIHTQSTRTSANPGCCGGSTGGLDDRFDVFLSSSHVINGGAKIKYIPGSYIACGNDGNHFNAAITDVPVNSIVPANVNTALFNMSDHLPVQMDLYSGVSAGLNENFSSTQLKIRFSKSNSGESFLNVESLHETKSTLKIFGISGNLLTEKNIQLKKGFNAVQTDEFNLTTGTYIAELKSANGHQASCLYLEN